MERKKSSNIEYRYELTNYEHRPSIKNSQIRNEIRYSLMSTVLAGEALDDYPTLEVVAM